MAISDLIEDELALYKKYVAEQAARNRSDGEEAKYHVDEVVSLGLFVIERIREHDPAACDSGRSSGYPANPGEERARHVMLYETWLADTRRLIARIDSLVERNI